MKIAINRNGAEWTRATGNCNAWSACCRCFPVSSATVPTLLLCSVCADPLFAATDWNWRFDYQQQRLWNGQQIVAFTAGQEGDRLKLNGKALHPTETMVYYTPTVAAGQNPTWRMRLCCIDAAGMPKLFWSGNRGGPAATSIAGTYNSSGGLACAGGVSSLYLAQETPALLIDEDWESGAGSWTLDNAAVTGDPDEADDAMHTNVSGAYGGGSAAITLSSTTRAFDVSLDVWQEADATPDTNSGTGIMLYDQYGAEVCGIFMRGDGAVRRYNGTSWGGASSGHSPDEWHRLRLRHEGLIGAYVDGAQAGVFSLQGPTAIKEVIVSSFNGGDGYVDNIEVASCY